MDHTPLAKVLEALEAVPFAEVVGLTGPSGASGASSGQEVTWTIVCTLEAWRLDGGELQRKKLNLRKPGLAKEDLAGWQRLFRPYAVVRLQARVLADSPLGAMGLIAALVGPADDVELAEHAHELQRPVTREDATFGTFMLDPRVDWFHAQVSFEGRTIRLCLHDSHAVAESLATARAIFADEPGWRRRVEDCALEHLLALKNEGWLEEDEAGSGAAEFKARMTLETIAAHPDGTFVFWYDDGDLFWGHSIEVRGTLAEGPTHADIAG